MLARSHFVPSSAVGVPPFFLPFITPSPLPPPRFLVGVGIPGILLVCLGVPAWIIVIMKRLRDLDRLNDPDVVARFGCENALVPSRDAMIAVARKRVATANGGYGISLSQAPQVHCAPSSRISFLHSSCQHCHLVASEAHDLCPPGPRFLFYGYDHHAAWWCADWTASMLCPRSVQKKGG